MSTFNDWKTPQLKEHLQYSLGHIDSLQWVLSEVPVSDTKLIHALRDRLKVYNATKFKLESLIEVIAAKKKVAKAKTSDHRNEKNGQLA